MNRIALLGVLGISLIACGSSTSPHEQLLGVWQSNEEMTLESMRQVDGVPGEARALFENDFLGNLIVEYREDTARMVSDKDGLDSGFQPYEVIEASADQIRIRELGNAMGDSEKTLHFEGDCYYIVVSRFEFREYFCRVE
jgi:hypothetical protein